MVKEESAASLQMLAERGYVILGVWTFILAQRGRGLVVVGIVGRRFRLLFFIMPNKNMFPEPSFFTEKLYSHLKKHPKRIVFADGEDIRVLRVAEKMVSMEIGVPILLGNRERIHAMAKESEVSMKFVSVIDPSKSETALFCSRLEKVSRFRGKQIANAKELVARPHNYAAMMIQYGHADGMIAGNASLPASVFRAAMTMIKPLPDVSQVFGAMVLVAPHLDHFGRDGVLFMADCGVIPEPDIQQLASIAIETGKLASHFLGRVPRVAMLSHSTHGSAGTDAAKKMAAATELARQKINQDYLELEIDGEVQADVALDASAAEVKLTDSRAQESADVLVFPNLDAGHISLKLLQHTAKAQNYGQLIMGLARPAAQVPRTVSEETLLGTAAVIGVEAIKANDLLLDKLSE
ncbi:MAG: phosphate acyltransferase [Akkermansiaceae bacterium]